MDNAKRWAAVVRRDANYDGQFVYCVKSTKIYCRPICKARLARRVNVSFCDTAAEAEALGYRACKRCQPSLASYNPEADRIKRSCDLLQALPADAPLPGLERLAQEAGLTKHHFHRLFKRETGQTPREYALTSRSSKASDSTVSKETTPMTPSTNPSDAPLPAEGYSEADVDWDNFVAGPDPYGYDLVGYTVADEFSKDQAFDGVNTLFVYFSTVETTYGKLLVAFKGHQVCKLELGSSEAELMASLEANFPSSCYIHCHVSLADEAAAVVYQQRVDAVADALQFPTGKMLDMPLCLGTA